MRKLVIGFALTLALAGCATPSPSPTPSKTTPTATSIVGCYGVRQGKNHYNLEILTIKGDVFTARMTYDNYQFDSSQGSFEGTYTDGVLLGIYSFIAEGVFNQRDLIFKRAGTDFIEGFGEYETIGNYDHLIDPGSAAWDESFRFTPEQTCPTVWK